MDDVLIMDVSGAWVRKDVGSAVQRMNAKADETERRFLARHLGRVPDTLDPKTACDRDKQKPLD
ncbi:MAG TPA: hypothetical protein DEO58_06865 [Alphaproteobacteria bacterium]|jgi:hypothetical protein|nr:hypothetical protein [Alphaproteobacteria bacterium]HCA14506.1 hypothetical protein [Alphaproteobacteria bacterium]HCA91029.1 hypothetical protein [Alphaproteobacteria bacterium]HCD78878.1 hypothetical protein [Alphaproteobacteria bacterium]|tara:strand:- start:240 stop:431 length:192 start_codon:yes stop_codon:yes gene_type:complete